MILLDSRMQIALALALLHAVPVKFDMAMSEITHHCDRGAPCSMQLKLKYLNSLWSCLFATNDGLKYPVTMIGDFQTDQF
jgi:hypothetical protein